MKKDIEWLKEEVKEGRARLIVGFDGGTESYYATDIGDALDFLTDYDARFTVSKEPVIPKFVAEWYESEGKRSSWWNWFYKWGRDDSITELEEKAIRWMQDYNEEAFVNLFLHGYEVAKEQKYYAKIKGHENIDSNDKYWNYCIADKSLDIGDNKVHADVLAEYVLSATKDEWTNLGINEDNADFVKVEEKKQ